MSENYYRDERLPDPTVSLDRCATCGAYVGKDKSTHDEWHEQLRPTPQEDDG